MPDVVPPVRSTWTYWVVDSWLLSVTVHVSTPPVVARLSEPIQATFIVTTSETTTTVTLPVLDGNPGDEPVTLMIYVPVAVSPSCTTNVSVALALPSFGTVTQAGLTVGVSTADPVTVRQTCPAKPPELVTVMFDVHVSSPENVTMWSGVGETLKPPPGGGGGVTVTVKLVGVVVSPNGVPVTDNAKGAAGVEPDV